MVPCSYPEQLPANTLDLQAYLGKWYFKAAVSHREADIRMFRAMDNILFTMEETAKDTLLLTGNMRIGDNCAKQTWIYHIRPDRDDLELEGRPQRRTLLWSGNWTNCPECIILQEIEPPLDETGTEDSLSRHMLYCLTCQRARLGGERLVAGPAPMGPGRAQPEEENRIGQQKLDLGTWNVTSLVGKKPELEHEVEMFRPDIRTHLNVRQGLWNQTSREGLDSLPLWRSQQ
ncbi:apolipoprotein M [Aulostomus maculatus]